MPPQRRVSVIGTFHEDCGATNASEVLAILDRLQPDVLFLEVPAAALDWYFTGPDRTPESRAVGRYQLTRSVALVPLDLPTPPAEFFENNKALYLAIENISPEYCRLVDRHRQRRRAQGFAYLNSDDAHGYWSELEEAERSAVKALADDRLAKLYHLWRDTEERRDLAMVKGIEDYCQHHSFGNGVFLVGAAHRPSIRRKARGGSSAVHWEFPGLLEQPVDGV